MTLALKSAHSFLPTTQDVDMNEKNPGYDAKWKKHKTTT
jgi:hypothetical protein